MIAIALIGVLAGLGLTAYNGQADDKELRTAAVKVEALASRARTLAFLKQQPHRLRLLSPREVVIEKPSENSDTKGFVSIEKYTANVDIDIRRWGANDSAWLRPTASTSTEPITWDFSPTGLCEPISIRLSERQNWIVLHMDPLSARVQEEESYIAR